MEFDHNENGYLYRQTVQLQWDHAKSVIESPVNADSKCPIARYIVRLKTGVTGRSARRRSPEVADPKSSADRLHSSRSRTWKVDGASRAVTLTDLAPSTAHYVRVLAVACDGTRGRPSPWIGLHTGLPASGVVSSSVEALSSERPARREPESPDLANVVAPRRGYREESEDEDYESMTVNDEQGRAISTLLIGCVLWSE